MDTVERYRQIIERILTEYAQIPYAYGDIRSRTVFDRAKDHYLLISVVGSAASAWVSGACRYHRRQGVDSARRNGRRDRHRTGGGWSAKRAHRARLSLPGDKKTHWLRYGVSRYL